MSGVVLNILCEGQTEERFVAKVLKPYLRDNKEMVVKSRLLLTSRKKNSRGGMSNYEKVTNDLRTWMKEAKDNQHETNFFTTMFDLYGLPTSFPGFKDAMAKSDCYDKVQSLETAFAQDINEKNFIPYIQLHEFEALVFCGLDFLKKAYPRCSKTIADLEEALSKCDDNPEKINNSPDTAPSKRLAKAFAGQYNYDKPKIGTEVTAYVGIDAIRKKCKHFDEWLKKIERLPE